MSDQIHDSDEVLFRQVHPDFIQNGEPVSHRFYPQSNDDGKLSVDRGGITTAEHSHLLYTSSGKQSQAVFGVSVGEFASETVPVYAAPTEETEDHPANDAHALADYTNHGTSQQRKIGKRLKRQALARGQLHP
ncbi:hypothetical protein [uncultured Erythrobacter sp.]|uniref:hypothetical protein n=1 Tax=uncultured Erythrobacter sp. TaxID=263913 RepID=UPI00262542A7|nr:hypothetical protein [uncultured Erythrobacter sp.]